MQRSKRPGKCGLAASIGSGDNVERLHSCPLSDRVLEYFSVKGLELRI